MKRFILTVGAALLLTTPLLAENSLHFSTKPGAEFAWELAWNGSQWQLSFVDDAIIVDDSNPDDAQLANDYVLLPTMNISGIDDRGGLLMATLNPRRGIPDPVGHGQRHRADGHDGVRRHAGGGNEHRRVFPDQRRPGHRLVQ